MAKKRHPAKTVAQSKGGDGFRIDHAEVLESDWEWLAPAQHLTLWNVVVPPGFLARLPNLWWLDIRGGSASDLEVARGAVRLEFLAVNQIRGMRDLSVLAEMPRLRYLQLYGLPHVTHLPSLAALTQLGWASLGQMIGLQSLRGALHAPQLRQLQLVRKINISDDDVNAILEHPTIEEFGWFFEDVPVRIWEPVMNKIEMPSVQHSLTPSEWFTQHGRYRETTAP